MILFVGNYSIINTYLIYPTLVLLGTTLPITLEQFSTYLVNKVDSHPFTNDILKLFNHFQFFHKHPVLY